MCKKIQTLEFLCSIFRIILMNRRIAKVLLNHHALMYVHYSMLLFLTFGNIIQRFTDSFLYFINIVSIIIIRILVHLFQFNWYYYCHDHKICVIAIYSMRSLCCRVRTEAVNVCVSSQLPFLNKRQ